MRLIGIATKPARRGPMQLLETATISKEAGLLNDCRGTGGRSKKRQVTLLSLEHWQDACREVGVALPWCMRRANLCIEGITFGPRCVGKWLAIGKDVIVEITGETDPCNRMDEVCVGLKDALTPHWRGGVTCQVIQSGPMRLDDIVDWNV